MGSSLPCNGTDIVSPIVEDKSKIHGGLLPALHAIQEALGWIPPEALPLVAAAFNRSRAEVHGVLTFYHDFCTAPPAKHRVRICGAEACQSMGAQQLVAEAEQLLGCAVQGRNADASVSLESVYCLGQCAAAPAMVVDERLCVRVTPKDIARILADVRKEST